MVKQNKMAEAFAKTKIGKQLDLNLSINLAIIFCVMLFLMGFSLGSYTTMIGDHTSTRIEINTVNALFIPLLVILYGFLVLTVVSGTKYILALMAYGQRTHKRN